MESHPEQQLRRPEDHPRQREWVAPARVRILEARNPVDGSRLTSAEHVALARSLDLRPLADRRSHDEALRIVRVMAPDSRGEQGRLVAMWLPRNAPSDFVVDLSREPAPGHPEGGGGDYLSPVLSAKVFWMLLEAPTIVTFLVENGIVLASYPDHPSARIDLGQTVEVIWSVVGNPLAIGAPEIEFRWLSVTDGFHKYEHVPPSSSMFISPTDLATLDLTTWNDIYGYVTVATLWIGVNKPPPPPQPGPPPPPPPPPPTTVGFSEVKVTNGNLDGHDMEVWLWDDTTGGPWQDMMTAPSGNQTVEVPLPISGHYYEVKVVDPNRLFCTAGNDPTEWNCVAWGTTVPVLADPRGQPFPVNVS